MKLLTRVGLAAIALPTIVLAYVACSSDPVTGTSPSATTTTTSTSPTGTTTTTSTTPPPGDSGPSPDGATSDAGCTYPKPEMDGGGLCGTRDFGAAAAILVTADAGFGSDAGTALPPGIYDVTSGERAAPTIPYNWRETFVIDGNRYTQIRRFDGAQGTPGVTTYRSGTYTLANDKITLTSDCAYRDDAGTDAGVSSVTYDVVTVGCKTTLRVVTAGVQLSYTRR